MQLALNLRKATTGRLNVGNDATNIEFSFMHLTNAMQSESGSGDPDLTQRGQFRGREVQLLNYTMNTVFLAFPYQYKSMLN